MKAVLSFSAELLLSLKPNISPSDGYFYLRRLRIARDHYAWLTSSFLSAEGNACFWEESLATSWSEADDEGVYMVSLCGSEIGVEVEDEAAADICDFIAEADETDPEILADIFYVEVAFKLDGDADEDLIISQSCRDVFECSIQICDDDHWGDLGYD